MKVSGINNQEVQNAKLSKENSDTKAFEAALEKAKKSGNTEEIKKVCQEFESLFINMMFKSMRKTIDTNGLFEKSNAQETYEGMFDEEVSKEISKAGGMGLSDYLYKSMIKQYDIEPKDKKQSIDFKG